MLFTEGVRVPYAEFWWWAFNTNHPLLSWRPEEHCTVFTGSLKIINTVPSTMDWKVIEASRLTWYIPWKTWESRGSVVQETRVLFRWFHIRLNSILQAALYSTCTNDKCQKQKRKIPYLIIKRWAILDSFQIHKSYQKKSCFSAYDDRFQKFSGTKPQGLLSFRHREPRSRPCQVYNITSIWRDNNRLTWTGMN